MIDHRKQWADFNRDFGNRNPSAGLSHEEYLALGRRLHAEYGRLHDQQIAADRAAFQQMKNAGIKPVFYAPNGERSFGPSLGSGFYVELAQAVARMAELANGATVHVHLRYSGNIIQAEPEPTRPAFLDWMQGAPEPSPA